MTMKIIGTGSCCGDHLVTNQDLAQIVETSDEWISSRTGIRSRRLTTGLGTSGMAAKAAERALKDGNVHPEELDLILLATSTPENHFPNGACEVQAAIGAVNAAAFDISAACTGFVFALQTAYGFMAAGGYKKILVIGADDLSKVTDWTDRKTCILFGDGAGAAVVRACDENGQGIIGGQIGSDGKKAAVLSCRSRTMGNFLTGKKPEPGYIVMEGQEVFKFAVKKVPECVETLMESMGIGMDEVKYLILHQANYRICESIARRLRISMDKIPMNIEKYGNTSGASIPLLLDELNREGKLKKGDKLVLAGFGAGLTWGAVLVEW